MKFLQRFLYSVMGGIGLVFAFIIMCHINPALAEKLGGSLQANAQENTASDMNGQKMQETETVSVDQTTGLSTEIQKRYEVIDEESLQIPLQVMEKNGYEPIEEKSTQISVEQAAELLETLGTGNLGEEYQYPKEYYPYYDMLDEKSQNIYRQLHANAESLTKSFAPSVEGVTRKQLKNAFTALCQDHPELFWLNPSIGSRFTPAGKLVEIDLYFNYTANDLETAKQTFEKTVREIVLSTRGLPSVYEKEKYVHDYLAGKIKYDVNAPINQSAYSALVQNRTVCAGYARAFQYILQQLEIPAYYCAGYSGGNHAWNIVKLDDNEFYNVDVTWDDQNPLSYDYFNCTDARYKTNHARRDLSIYLPACNGRQYMDLAETEEEKAKREQEEQAKLQEQLKLEEEQKKVTEQTTKTVVVEKKEQTSTLPGEEQLNIEFIRAAGGEDIVILTTLQQYYTDCAQAMMDDDDNSISFTNVVANERMWRSIKRAYEKGEYNGAYMNRVLADKHKTVCTATVTAQKLADGTYLIRHVMTLR